MSGVRERPSGSTAAAPTCTVAARAKRQCPVASEEQTPRLTLLVPQSLISAPNEYGRPASAAALTFGTHASRSSRISSSSCWRATSEQECALAAEDSAEAGAVLLHLSSALARTHLFHVRGLITPDQCGLDMESTPARSGLPLRAHC